MHAAVSQDDACPFGCDGLDALDAGIIAATERANDPTVERCERRARALGYGAFRVTNIFAWRATDPRDMRAAIEPVGRPENDAAIEAAAAWADRVVCAWGTHGAFLGRGAEVERRLRATGRPLAVLGLSKDGHPKHPLYIGYGVPPVDWPPSPGPSDGR